MYPILIQADIHTHSISSGHYSTDTVTTMLRQAKSVGLRLLGISEHGPGIPGSCTLSYFRSLSSASRSRMGVEVLYGAEVDLMDEKRQAGKMRGFSEDAEGLDMPEEVMARLDYCIAGMHPPCYCPGTANEHTAAYIRAMRNPYVRFISHPEDEKYPADYEALVRAAVENRVILEVNNSSLSPEGYRGEPRAIKRNMCELVELCKQYGHPVLLSSDSHGHAHVGDVPYAQKLLQEMNFPPELVINRRAEDLILWLRS